MNEQYHSGPQSSKRDFLKYVLGGGLLAWFAAVAYPILAYLKPPKQGEVEVSSVKVGALSAIEKESGTIVRFGNKPVILVRTAAGELRAFSATCTHLDCTVQYKADTSQLWCPCHNGLYDLSGNVVSGPPPRPLEGFQVNLRGDPGQEDVVISRI